MSNIILKENEIKNTRKANALIVEWNANERVVRVVTRYLLFLVLDFLSMCAPPDADVQYTSV